MGAALSQMTGNELPYYKRREEQAVNLAGTKAGGQCPPYKSLGVPTRDVPSGQKATETEFCGKKGPLSRSLFTRLIAVRTL